MQRLTRLLAIVALLLTLPMAASADEHEMPEFPKNPVKACEMLAEVMPEAYEFLATQPGGCVSSVASVGVQGLMMGEFPSIASAVGNCKFIEELVGGYPYDFYGQFTARNRAECISWLKFFHGGGLG